MLTSGRRARMIKQSIAPCWTGQDRLVLQVKKEERILFFLSIAQMFTFFKGF